VLAAAAVVAGCQIQISRVPKPEPVASLAVARVGRITDRVAISNAAWSPDGEQVAFGTEAGLFTVRVDTAQERNLAPLRPVTALEWARTGAWLAALVSGRLFVVRAADGAATPLFTDGVVRAFRWGPGGDHGIAIVERNGYHAWLLSADGAVRRHLVSSPSGTWMGDLAWYPDGAHAFVRVEDAAGATRAQWRLRVSGVDRSTVTHPNGAVAVSALSPDGRRIAYIRGREGSTSLWQGSADGGPLRRIDEAGRIIYAAWSPQSDKIAYAEVTDDDRATIWITDADGTGRLRVTDYRPELADHGIEVALVWSPTGRALAFGTNTVRSAGPLWVAHLSRR
jgi:Tol biopolymer transport system component